MNWRQMASDYLTFSRKEKVGIILILLVIFLVFLFPYISTRTVNTISTTDSAWISRIQNLERKTSDKMTDLAENEEDNRVYQYDQRLSSQPHITLFYFNPNTLPAEDWKKLGLRDRTIKTILNYREKGGRFYKPEDLQKIYGLQKQEYERLAPYIRIESPGFTKTSAGKPDFLKTENPPVFRYAIIDINEADTTQFISLPGIGSRLAARIINFRDKLGGFYSIEQVGETYGVPDSTFQKIKPFLKLGNRHVQKININEATAAELSAHPYLTWQVAKAIVAYRNEHGRFSVLEELKKVMLVTEELFLKTVPYLTVNLPE